MGFWDALASAGRYAKQSAPRSGQITTPTLHRSIFYRPGALPDAQPTVPEHWRQFQLNFNADRREKRSRYSAKAVCGFRLCLRTWHELWRFV